MKEVKINHKERAHALLSASGASRWLNCTPSALLEEHFEDKSSAFAEEGTLAHELAELKLRQWALLGDSSELADSITQVRHSALYSNDMEMYVDNYVSYVREVFAEAQQRDHLAEIFTEIRVNFSRWVPEGFGTVDNCVIGRAVMDVIDLKFGKGIAVSAVDNPQLKLYALGALEGYGFMYDVDTVRLHIHQPRLDAISVYELSVADLLEWAETEVKPKADRAINGEGEQVPGTWCQFCKAKSRCTALAKEAEEVAQFDFQDPKLLTDQQVLEVYAKADRLTRWLSSLGDYILQEALAGRKWDGYKLVEGRSNRRLTDTEAVIGTLTSEGWQPSDFMKSELQGITALEKLLGKKAFEATLGKYTEKPPGKPTLVDQSDKRQELDLTSDFDDDFEEKTTHQAI